MKKIAKHALGLTAGALLVVTAFAGCAGKSSAAEDTIKIGILQPVTGGLAGGAAIEIEGIKLANAETPTVLGKKVELVTADNKSDKTEAANAASRLIFNDKVVAIIGSYASSPSIGAGDTIKKGETPAIGVSCTNPLVTKGNDWYFRVCFIDPYQGKVMANYAFNKMGAKTAAVTREVGSDYSVGLAQFFTDEFTRLGGTIVATADYQTGDQDFSAQITNVAKAKPDIIFTPGNFTECAMFIKQARKLGVTAPFLGGDTYETPEFLTVGGTEVNGAIFSTFFDAAAPLTSKTKPFIDKYRAANGGKDPAAVTVLAYDAYNVLLDAITRAGSTDRAKIRQALLETKDFEGVAGFVNFDENRDAKKPAVIKKVVDGKFTYVDSISAE
jgi:branched-chain amino acid transport system substrate-binding protein